MNKSGYAIECKEFGSREIKKGEPKNSITVKTMLEVTFRILECKDCGYKEREDIKSFFIKTLFYKKEKHLTRVLLLMPIHNTYPIIMHMHYIFNNYFYGKKFISHNKAASLIS
ncbi:hypothetical protein [Bacillus albus]|uniref:hypothetical protein n=1 Tax=Bacillus albus TaxID=2026189 RepID=UPI0014194580|nr:hypothetical protein [Bacillus albus]